MIDVYVRCWPDSEVRAALSEAVIQRLLGESGCRITLLISEASAFELSRPYNLATLQVPATDYHRESKAVAAGLPGYGEHLIIVDDDQLPLYRDWVGYAVSLTKRYPEYAAIAGWSVTNEVPRPAALVEESDSIGCPMIVRRDALLDATSEPIENSQRADTILTARLQRHGKTGIARNWRYNHLGMGYSQCIPAHWIPECPA